MIKGLMSVLRRWSLLVSIVVGAGIYLLLPSLFIPRSAGGLGIVPFLFPLTLFVTLYATFARVRFHAMRLRPWHLLLIGSQILLALLLLGLLLILQHQPEAPLPGMDGTLAAGTPLLSDSFRLDGRPQGWILSAAPRHSSNIFGSALGLLESSPLQAMNSGRMAFLIPHSSFLIQNPLGYSSLFTLHSSLKKALFISSAPLAASAFFILHSSLFISLAPCAAGAPVIAQRLGGSLPTMTTFMLLSSLLSLITLPLLIPLLPALTPASPLATLLAVAQRLALLLLLPLLCGWITRRHLPPLSRLIDRHPNLSFHTWCLNLIMITGITLHNIATLSAQAQQGAPLFTLAFGDTAPAQQSESELSLLSLTRSVHHSPFTIHHSPKRFLIPHSSFLIFIAALAALLACLVQYLLGSLLARHSSEPINTRQGMFQKNTALAIYLATTFLHPLIALSAGCYVLWQNILNALELSHHNASSS